MKNLVLLTSGERALIVSNRKNNTFIVRTKNNKYKVIKEDNIELVLR
jgi:hypothetical protein